MASQGGASHASKPALAAALLASLRNVGAVGTAGGSDSQAALAAPAIVHPIPKPIPDDRPSTTKEVWVASPPAPHIHINTPPAHGALDKQGSGASGNRQGAGGRRGFADQVGLCGRLLLGAFGPPPPQLGFSRGSGTELLCTEPTPSIACHSHVRCSWLYIFEPLAPGR